MNKTWNENEINILKISWQDRPKINISKSLKLHSWNGIKAKAATLNLKRNINTCDNKLNKLLSFLKSKIKALDLPVLSRKWDRITKKYIQTHNSQEMKCKIIEYRKLYKVSKIAAMLKINASYVYQVLSTKEAHDVG
jgi:hypothetical protein